ncbi:hypothetical protein [Methyloceanibacter sp. wino2]|uniref:hypothetical protein n=1 Tax=Methyloceanibacter sp. wino2 TaxID=2170729 RepID=UPI000D3E8D5E|nr:hypothetical protein [Methyloceanibacter sp. wino2]
MDVVAVTGSGESRGNGGGKSLRAKPDVSESHVEFASRQDAADYIADYLTQLLLLAFRYDMPELAYCIGKSLSKANEQKARPD